MDGKEIALKVAKENDALYIERNPDWNGKECWFMYFYEPGSEIPIIGSPQYILTDGESYTITDPDEATEYIEYLDEEYGFDDNGDLIGFEDNELVKVV